MPATRSSRSTANPRPPPYSKPNKLFVPTKPASPTFRPASVRLKSTSSAPSSHRHYLRNRNPSTCSRATKNNIAAGGISETDLITARAAVESNIAIVRQYQSNIAVAELAWTRTATQGAGGSHRRRSRCPEQAQWKLQQKQIASPRDGLVFDTLYRTGEWVPAGSPIVQLLPPENIEVRFFVPETTVGSLKLGQKISVHCDGCSSDVLCGHHLHLQPGRVHAAGHLQQREPLQAGLHGHRQAAVDKAPLLHPGQPLEVTLQ